MPGDIGNILSSLARSAASLDPDHDQRKYLLKQVVDYLGSTLEQLEQAPAFLETHDFGRGIYDSPIVEEPLDIEAVLGLLHHNVDLPGINQKSGSHLGFIAGGGLFLSALGDLLAASTNRFAGRFASAPGAVRMENLLLRWMADFIRYPAEAGGTLTSGGSIGNLTAIVTAREACRIDPAKLHRVVLYLTTQSHHSILKGLKIAGLEHCLRRYVTLDASLRMDANDLERLIRNDEARGLRPWMIVATAGTINSGAVDPLASIADIAHRYGVWLHVDAAYGGFFALCSQGVRVLSGIERSDSVVLDPHKGLFLPYGTGAVLVRDKELLRQTFAFETDYLHSDTLMREEEVSPCDLSPELTRHFRGLRLWLPLKVLGLAPFRSALEEKMWLARYFYDRIQQVGSFRVGAFPDLSIVLFRHESGRGNHNESNRRLVDKVQKEGQVFLGSTRIDDRLMIRLAVMSYKTHRKHVDLAIDILGREAAALAAPR